MWCIHMTDENDEVERYQEEISEETASGGGCCETWEALDEHRESNTPSATRRGLLRGVGATAGVALGSGLIQTVSADSVDTEEIKKSTAVRSLLEAVGDPNITDQKVRTYHGKNNFKMRRVDFKTKVGTLSQIEVTSSNTEKVGKGESSTEFRIEDLTSVVREELPNRFSSVPLGVKLALKWQSGGVQIRRTITKSERKELANRVDVDEFYGLHFGEKNGFYFVQGGEKELYKIDDKNASSSINIQDATVQQITTEQVSNACFDCGSTSGGCATCAFDCNPVSGGLLFCAACILENCRNVDTRACAKCLTEIIPRIIV